MAAESSFDVVSKVDRQEVDNALHQSAKEIQQRYDFKGTDASIAWSGEVILMRANSEDRVKAVLDVFQTKLIKRNVSLKAIDPGDPKPSGKEYRIEAALGLEPPPAAPSDPATATKDDPGTEGPAEPA